MLHGFDGTHSQRHQCSANCTRQWHLLDWASHHAPRFYSVRKVQEGLRHAAGNSLQCSWLFAIIFIWRNLVSFSVRWCCHCIRTIYHCFQANAFRALRFLFSKERNRRLFKRVFPPDMFEMFIDIGHYNRDISAYKPLVKKINSLGVRFGLIIKSS